MKSIVQPLVRRWRQESSSAIVVPASSPGPSRRPFRLWLTGSLAVVMTVMVPLRGASEEERHQAMRLLRHSPFDVSETLQRIEVAARDQGLSVLAKLAGSPPMLVLASSIGGTLVVMHGPDSRPAMPLSLMVSPSRDGGADVLVAADENEWEASDWSELPRAVADDVRALPQVLDRALR